MEKLKPCPFCGCDDQLESGIKSVAWANRPAAYVRCESCGVEMHEVKVKAKDAERAVVERWNDRHPDADAMLDGILRVAGELREVADHA